MSNRFRDFEIRRAVPEDAAVCGEICYDAFAAISEAHGFPCDFPGPGAGIGLLTMMFSSPEVYCVVAERDGQVLGSNCLDERAVIRGVGPITVNPTVQNTGVGRALMEAVIARAEETGAAGVRLLQAGYHARSLALYTGLGFEVREPIACLQGAPIQEEVSGCNVRLVAETDLAECNALSRRLHGYDRGVDLRQSMFRGTARVVERGGRITGYTSNMAFFGHTTAETNVDLQALIAAAEGFGGPGILLPMRNSQVFQWCLAKGLRVTQTLTVMSLGLYQEPTGAWMPSVLF